MTLEFSTHSSRGPSTAEPQGSVNRPCTFCDHGGVLRPSGGMTTTSEPRSRCSGLRLLHLGGVLVVLVVAAGSARAASAIAVTPAPLGFGGGAYNQLGGGAVGERQLGFFQIQNTGTTKLVVTDMAIVGDDTGIMAFDGADDPFCGSGHDCTRTYTLAPGELRGFQTTCTPTQPGVFSATLRIASNAHGTSTTPITCIANHAPVIAVSPGALDFGTVHACAFGDACGPGCATTSPPAGLTITNTAPPPSELDFYLTPTLPSARYADFEVGQQPTQDTPYALAAGESYFLPIAFHPRNDSAWTQPLTLVSLFPGQPPVSIPLHALGGSGRLEIDTTGLGTCAFGESLATTITGHNAGSSCLELGSMFMYGDCQVVGDSSFLLLQPGESFTRAVSCTPTLSNFGVTELLIDIPHDAPEFFDQYFQCEPTGGVLTTDSFEVLFISQLAVRVGSSATQRVQVSNAGAGPMQLVSITGDDPRLSAALVTGSLPITLAPGDSVAVDVAFAPTSEATVTGAVTFGVSSGLGTTLPVTGEGFVNDGVAFPRAIDFQGVFYPSTPSRWFAVLDHGDQPLTVEGVTIDPPGDFAISVLAPGTVIAAGDAASANVTATPTSLGLLQATASIALDRGPDVTVALQAFSTDGSMLVLPQRLELGPIDIASGSHEGHASVINETNHPITFATCTLVGDPALALHTTCPITFTTLQTVDLAVGFDPSVVGEASGVLVVTGTGFATGSLHIPVHGTGVDPSAPPSPAPGAPARRADMARAGTAAPAPRSEGGCQVGGSAGAPLVLALGLIVRRRRGRRSPARGARPRPTTRRDRLEPTGEHRRRS